MPSSDDGAMQFTARDGQHASSPDKAHRGQHQLLQAQPMGVDTFTLLAMTFYRYLPNFMLFRYYLI